MKLRYLLGLMSTICIAGMRTGAGQLGSDGHTAGGRYFLYGTVKYIDSIL